MCLPCAVPWLAGILIALGIHGPFLPYGAIPYVLAAAATYRVAQLICIDDGPFDVFLRLREKVGCYEYGEDGRPTRGLARLLACPYCVGIWVSLPFIVLTIWRTIGGDLALAMFGIAGIQAWMQGAREGESHERASR